MISRAMRSTFLVGALALALQGAACAGPETDGLFGGAGTGASSASNSSTTGTGGAASASTSSSSGTGGVPAGCQCDGNDLDGKTCASLGYVDPSGLACTSTCMFDTSGCHAVCGNNVAEPGEKCDGTDLGGATCATFGYVNPAGLVCSPDCSGWNSSKCHATCGNGVVEPGEACDDGASNGKPGDPCSSICTIVKDQTGLSCGAAIPISTGLGTTNVMGSTVGGGEHTAVCSSMGPDIVYLLEVQADGFLTASLPRPSASFDSVLYIAAACTDGGDNDAILCADSTDPTGQTTLFGGEVVSIRVKAGDLYYVFVDGRTQANAGSYELEVDLAAGLDCTDPVPIPLYPGTPMTVIGSTTGIAPGDVEGSCGGSLGGQVVYQITRPNTAPIGVATSATYTNYNSVLYARTVCGDMSSEIACSNQGDLAQESIDLPNVMAAVPVYVYIDGSTFNGGAASGNYGLVLTP